MKNQHKLTKETHPLKNVLAMSLSAIMTSMMCASTASFASDIEIYQQARSGKVTLMFALDISRSMTNSGSYDLPSGCDSTSENQDPFVSTSPNITYPRVYKSCKNPNAKVYSYANDNGTWYTCSSSNLTDRSKCSGSSRKLSTVPSITGLLSEVVGNKTYYYQQNLSGLYYRRLDRVRDAMYQLLYGNNPISDDRVIGLSVFPYDTGSTTMQEKTQILVPARPLNEDVNGKTQRQILIETIANIDGTSGTPTANMYAEVASYLFGTKTYSTLKLKITPPSNAITHRYYKSSSSGNWYQECVSFSNSVCSEWSIRVSSKNTNFPSGSGESCSFKDEGNNRTGNCWKKGTAYEVEALGNSGFFESRPETWNQTGTAYERPTSLNQTNDQKTCSGQGIYLLTDGEPNGGSSASGLMKNALGTHGNQFECTDSTSGWGCMHEFVGYLLNETKNPLGLKVKTAIVGFGGDFNSVPSYSKSLSVEDNIANIEASDAGTDQKNAAKLGVNGRGGWYSGSSVEDVVASVNDFINSLSTEIPTVTTGSSTIPTDSLNPIALQNYAYYPQFQPTPDKNYQLWSGNLKKYKVTEVGTLVDKDDSLFVNAQGRILNNYDLWSADAVTAIGINQDDETILGTDANRLIGGVKAKLKLRTSGNIVQRKIFTDRSLTQVDSQYVSTDNLSELNLDLVSSQDPNRGYLLSLLGYKVNAERPETITPDTLSNAAELRQIGSVMHSSPVLITNKGKITYIDDKIGTDSREDYIFFGTTQGLLHVVDAKTGEEKFAFVPNEVVENQPKAFLNYDTTIGGIDKLYYGIDGPWTAYTEYVIDKADSDLLTVKEGKPYTIVDNNVDVTKEVKGKQIAYGGMRMGGRNYYALNLTDITKPQLQFKITPSGTDNCSATDPLACMGQSWSKPTITWVNWKGQKKLVMLVGGGYDAEGLPDSILDMPESNEAERIAKNAKIKHYKGYEYDDYVQANKIGSGVYMFDALNGNLLWWASANATANSVSNDLVSSYDADLKYSVVSQIKAVDRDTDGLTDHLYFGDLGGQVWRIDLNNNANTDLTLFAKPPTRILDINNGAGSRRFYEMPAFSIYSKDGNLFGVISIGSGNRSQPIVDYSTNLDTYQNDGVFNIYDKDVTRGDLYNLDEKQKYRITPFSESPYELKTKDITLLDEELEIGSASINQLVAIDDTNRFSKTKNLASYILTQGWYYLFESEYVQSEKVMSTPIVINNDMYVTTFDGSKDGMSGDCGAGVKGESFMTLFCMPFGQCNSGSVSSYRLNLGAGIVGGAVGAGDGDGMQRLIVANINTSGITGNEILAKRYNTANKLIPQRWYERR